MSNIGKVLGEFVTDHLDGVHPFTIRPIFQGTVMSIGGIGNSNAAGTVQVQRPGDVHATGYNYRIPKGYVPAIGDPVVVLNVPKTPVVLFKVSYGLYDTLNDISNSSTANPALLGFANITPGTACRLQLGASYSGLQRTYGENLQIFTPNTIELRAMAGQTTPGFRSETGNPAAVVVSQGTNPVLRVRFDFSGDPVADFQQWTDYLGTTVKARVDNNARFFAPKFICNTGPCVASGINAGITSATVSVTGSDQAGDITFTTTATPPAAGAALMTLTFASAFPSSTTPRVLCGLENGAPPTNGVWYSANRSNASWQVVCTTALAASTSYTIQFLCGE